jgi:AcrR family transcriptional regulator
MPYRRTEAVVRRLEAREQSILDAARTIVAEGGMGALQIAAVAERAQIAAGTVYRYFPSKTELVGELVTRLARAECAAMQAAGDAAPGPLSALAACIACFAARALPARRLIAALIGEPIDDEPAPIAFRRALAGELTRRIKAAVDGGQLPDQDAQRAGAAILGALVEGLIGPLAAAPADAAAARAAARDMTLMALRALGMVDARARGLVAQVALPPSVPSP